MARILLGSYMMRYPLGGMLSWALQYLLGFHRLGHEVYLVERADYHNACFDARAGVMTDDASYGIRVVDDLLRQFELEDRWAFVDVEGRFHGRSQKDVSELFRTADFFVDGGTHGAWLEWVSPPTQSVLIDGEPAFTQMKWENRRAAGQAVPEYDAYFTNGLLLGTADCTAPTAGRSWKPLVNPVVPELFDLPPAREGAPYTTVMNWQSHAPIEFAGTTYGQKDVEFEKFVELPRSTNVPLEVAVAGRFPRQRLDAAGWRIENAHKVTESFESYRRYIGGSRGEMSVCKNVFVATRTGWFSDRSAAYLAAGRPVVLEETGFSRCLPTGEGLFAVAAEEDAIEAIEAIEADFEMQSRRAREIAQEYLSAETVLASLLDDVGG
jgi:hypothetical protein